MCMYKAPIGQIVSSLSMGLKMPCNLAPCLTSSPRASERRSGSEVTHSDLEHSCEGRSAERVRGRERKGWSGDEVSNDVVVTRDDQIACHDTIGRFIAWRVGLGLAPALRSRVSPCFYVRARFQKEYCRRVGSEAEFCHAFHPQTLTDQRQF